MSTILGRNGVRVEPRVGDICRDEDEPLIIVKVLGSVVHFIKEHDIIGFTTDCTDLELLRRPFAVGDVVEKKSGSQWRGEIVGTYSTTLTPNGYAVESDTHAGSVQIYPSTALRHADPAIRDHEEFKPR